MKEIKDVYLKLTPDEVATITYALRTQYDNGDNLNFDGTENDELITKICAQEYSVQRPYVVVGVHDNGRRYIPKKVIVMAEDAESAIGYAKKKIENTSEDYFKVDPEKVHEMTEDEFSVEEL